MAQKLHLNISSTDGGKIYYFVCSLSLLKYHWETYKEEEHKLKQTKILSLNNKTEMILLAPYMTLTLGPLISQELT